MKFTKLNLTKFSCALALGAMLHTGLATAQETKAPEAPATRTREGILAPFTDYSR